MHKVLDLVSSALSNAGLSHKDLYTLLRLRCAVHSSTTESPSESFRFDFKVPQYLRPPMNGMLPYISYRTKRTDCLPQQGIYELVHQTSRTSA